MKDAGTRTAGSDGQRFWLTWAVWKACLWGLLGSGRILALDPGLPANAYLHAAWTQSESGPIRHVVALAQTKDGYLWIASSGGLLRFDGVKFTAWKPAPRETLTEGPIIALCASGDGDLWIGTSSGVNRLHGGHITSYTVRDGVPDGRVSLLIEDGAGDILVGTRGNARSGVARIHAPAAIRRLTGSLPAPDILSLYEDRRGRLWVGTQPALCLYSEGVGCEVSAQAGAQSIAEDSEGNLFVLTGPSKGVLRLSSGAQGIRRAPEFGFIGGSTLRTDRDGNLWVGSAGRGLLRWKNGKVDSFTRRDGLSGEVVTAILEDFDGNLWTGTNGGLDRLQTPPITRLPVPEAVPAGVATVVTAGRNNDTWIGTIGEGLVRVRNGKDLRILSGLSSRTITALHEDSRGTLWVGTTGGLSYSTAAGSFVPFRPAGGARLNRVFAVTSDRNGVVWLADAKEGVFSVRDRALKALSPPLPRSDVYQLHAARDGTLWIGYYGGGLTAVSGGSVRSWGLKDGLAGGAVQAIDDDPGGTVWIGTATGLSCYRRNRWKTWGAEQGLPAGGVSDIVSAGRGSIWLMTRVGLLQIEDRSLDLAGGGRSGLVPVAVIGASDGIATAWSGRAFNPRTVRTKDDYLLAAVENWVVRVDPGRVRSRTRPPDVVIEQLRADHREISWQSAEEIAVSGDQLEFLYTAPNLTSPESVQFRCKLEGLDQDWKMLGSNRRLLYGRLRPGHYRFLVTARNNGPWSPSPASLAFRIDPAFYERAVFRASCLAAAALLGWGLYRYRLHQTRQSFQLVFEERMRMTRELHDTLLQGFTAVVFQLEAAQRQFTTSPETSRRLLGSAVEQADCALSEARQAILALRLPALDKKPLREALSDAVRQLAEGTSIAISLHVSERTNELPYELQGNLYLICREAVCNAVNHGRPRSVTVDLDYTNGRYCLTVRDDGVGFDPQMNSPEGHLGLLAIRERAKRLRAELKIVSSPGNGTAIEVSGPVRLPARGLD